MIQFKIDATKDVAIYARVSSDDQQERETIQSQIEFGTKYCELHQMNIGAWYKDDGVSGTIPLELRPDGKQLIEDAKAGKFKTLLIYNMKRLGRKARITLDAIYQLEEYGVKIKSMTEPFDTGDPMGRFIITVLAGQAEFDRDTLLDTLWHGANRVARLGRWLGGIVPYGYRVNPKKYLEINPDPIPGKEEFSEPDVIRLMYHLVGNEKWSTVKVANYFNALHIPPSYVKDDRTIKKGKRKEKTAGIWRPGRIRNMIVNETYKGTHVYGKRANRERELITREVPAIVSEAQWDAAQEALRTNLLESTRNSRRLYLLRGLIKCQCCGLTYCGTTYKNKSYYACGGKLSFKGPIQGRCPSKNMPAVWLEEMVWQECVEFIQYPGDAIKELGASMYQQEEKKQTIEEEALLIQRSLEQKQMERQKILTLYRQQLITALDVEQQLQLVLTEANALESRLRELQATLEDEKSVLHQFDSAEALLEELRNKIEGEVSFETKRSIIKTLVQSIQIETIEAKDGRQKQGRVHVAYSFTNAQGNIRTDMDSLKPRAIYLLEM